MDYVMSFIGFIIYTIKCIIVFLIMVSPIVISYLAWYRYTLKQRKEMKKLRAKFGYNNEWQERNYEGEYTLKFKHYLKEFNPTLKHIRTFVVPLFIVFIVLYMVYLSQPTIEYTSYERQLFAFQDNQGFYIKGRALGSGSGSDEIVYYYTLSNGDGSFQSYRATANMSVMNYTNQNPHVKYTMEHQYMLDDKWFSGIARFLIPKGSDDGVLSRIDFYIPEGSVENNYNSDLK